VVPDEANYLSLAVERPVVPSAPPDEVGHRVIPAQAGIQERNNWIPAFAGMTYKGCPCRASGSPESIPRVPP